MNPKCATLYQPNYLLNMNTESGYGLGPLCFLSAELALVLERWNDQFGPNILQQLLNQEALVCHKSPLAPITPRFLLVISLSEIKPVNNLDAKVIAPQGETQAGI